MDQYEVSKQIGAGHFGAVNLAKRIATGELVVIKEIQISSLTKEEAEGARQESELLAQLVHPCIVEYKETIMEQGSMLLVMEYCDGGDLSTLVKERRSMVAESEDARLFDEDQILNWFVQIALALRYIHSKHILHRDLKTQNCFVTDEGNRVKLGDFGIAKVLMNEKEFAKTVIGTPYYLSPEICEGKSYAKKSDVWALGCILYELATLKHAFDGHTLPSLVMKILRGQYPPISERYSSSFRELLDSMLQQVPEKRPSIRQILCHATVRDRVAKFDMEAATSMNLPTPMGSPAFASTAGASAEDEDKDEEDDGNSGLDKELVQWYERFEDQYNEMFDDLQALSKNKRNGEAAPLSAQPIVKVESKKASPSSSRPSAASKPSGAKSTVTSKAAPSKAAAQKSSPFSSPARATPASKPQSPALVTPVRSAPASKPAASRAQAEEDDDDIPAHLRENPGPNAKLSPIQIMLAEQNEAKEKKKQFLKDRAAAKKAEQDAIKARQLEHKMKMASIVKRDAVGLGAQEQPAAAEKQPEKVPALVAPKSSASKAPAAKSVLSAPAAVKQSPPKERGNIASFLKEQRSQLQAASKPASPTPTPAPAPAPAPASTTPSAPASTSLSTTVGPSGSLDFRAAIREAKAKMLAAKGAADKPARSVLPVIFVSGSPPPPQPAAPQPQQPPAPASGPASSRTTPSSPRAPSEPVVDLAPVDPAPTLLPAVPGATGTPSTPATPRTPSAPATPSEKPGYPPSKPVSATVAPSAVSARPEVAPTPVTPVVNNPVPAAPSSSGTPANKPTPAASKPPASAPSAPTTAAPAPAASSSSSGGGGGVKIDVGVVEAMGSDRAAKLAVYIDTTRRMLQDMLGNTLFTRVYNWVKHDLQGVGGSSADPSDDEAMVKQWFIDAGFDGARGVRCLRHVNRLVYCEAQFRQ